MEEKLSLGQIAGIINDGGLGEALFGRIHPDEIEDEKLRFLWTQIRVPAKLVEGIIAEVPFED